MKLLSNPYEAALGANTVTVEEDNDQGVYYQWIAPAEGVLTITVSNSTTADFDIQLYNLTSYAMRNLTEEELVDELGNRYVSVKVSQGDVVSIGYMSVPNAEYKYAEVTVATEMTFVEGSNAEPNYIVTVKDGEGNPMAGVSISLNVNGVNTVFVSDENGVIAMILPSDIYTVKVTVPEGYLCDTTQFLLTIANPNKDIVMTLYVPVELTYTVYVVDEAGNPVPNAKVVIQGNTFVYTDANGMVSMTLLEGTDYVATIVPPEGYTIDKSKHAFGTKTTITVVLKLAVVEPQEIDYTVSVVDMDGKPYTNLLVRFDSIDGTISVIEAVDSNGKAKAHLPEGNYTVTLMFNDGSNMGYITPDELTPTRTRVTVKVIPYVSGETEMIFVNGADYEAIHIGCGTFYMDLSNSEIRYFLFTPEEAGVYTFTTTDPNAAVGFWNNTFFAFDLSSEYVKDNVCTLEVKTVGPTYVISVKGVGNISNAVLKVTRTGDAEQNTTIYEDYVGTTTPTQPFVSADTGSKHYLDLADEQVLVKGTDGFYHLGSPDGPVVYMDLTGVRFGISISAVVSNSSMVSYEFDANNKPIKRINYTQCMLSYVENVDSKYGVYALTDDLVTILQNHGNHAGWYEQGSYGYLFGEETVLEGQGWMFLLCTIQ